MKFPFWPDFKGYRNINLGLSRVEELLKRLDNPHLKLPPTIHIAGTNGKGSTLSFLRAIFAESNLKTHIYTSPHLVNFNERIVLAGSEISDEFLNQVLKKCQKASQIEPKIDVTFFEGITVAAFLAFSEVKADILLLETGMGGRLDATNVLPEVLCSIITPIAFDHTDFLGKTLGKIAFEKAGIIKKNCPVIVGKQKPSALQTIEKRAKELGCEIKVFGRDFNCDIVQTKPSLLGSYQIENAATAIAAALSQAKFKISKQAIDCAITKAKWPGRLQKITAGNLFEKLPKNCNLYLDGSHNLQGAATVKEFLKNTPSKKTYAIFAMLQDKDCAGFLKKIAPEIDQLICLTIADEPKSRKAEEVGQIAKKLKIKSTTAANFSDALTQVEENSLVLICGSLYLAGSFLSENSTT